MRRRLQDVADGFAALCVPPWPSVSLAASLLAVLSWYLLSR